MTKERAKRSTRRTKMPRFEVASFAIHPDDRGEMTARLGVDVDVRTFCKPIWVSFAAFQSVYALNRGTATELRRAGIFESKRSGSKAGKPTYWMRIDPSKDIQRVYEDWAADLPLLTKHKQFDLYKSVRRWMRVVARYPHPHNVLLGAAIKLEEIGSFHKTEIAAFLPLPECVRESTTQALKALCGEAGRRLALQGAVPSVDSLCEREPRLRAIPETHFTNPGIEAPCPASRRCLGQVERIFPAASSFLVLFAPKSRAPRRTSEIARAFLRFDQEFAKRHPESDHRDQEAIGDTLKHIITDDECRSRYRYYVRYRLVSFVLSSMRQMKRWIAHADPEAAGGMEDLTLATPADLDEIVELFHAEFKGRKGSAEGRRKAHSDKVSDALPEIDDCTTFRMEQLKGIEAGLDAAATKLPACGSLRCAIDTTVLDEKGRILSGSQRTYWTIWRASAIIPTIRTTHGTVVERDEQGLTSLAALTESGERPDEIFFEYNGCVPLVGERSEMPFFVLPFAMATIAAPNGLDVRSRRIRHRALLRTGLPAYTACSGGLLTFDRCGWSVYRYALARNRVIVPVKEFGTAMRFASVAYDLSRDTLARPHEVLQTVQDADGWSVKRVRGQAQAGFEAFPKCGPGKPLPKEPVWFPVSNDTFKGALALAERISGIHEYENGHLPMVTPLPAVGWKLPGDAALIFQWNGKALRMDEIALFLRYLLVGWREVRWYDLRHAGANEMREAGVPMRYIRAMLNHSDLRIAGYYARWTKRQKSTAVSNRVAKMRTIAADAEFRRAEA